MAKKKPTPLRNILKGLLDEMGVSGTEELDSQQQRDLVRRMEAQGVVGRALLQCLATKKAHRKPSREQQEHLIDEDASVEGLGHGMSTRVQPAPDELVEDYHKWLNHSTEEYP